MVTGPVGHTVHTAYPEVCTVHVYSYHLLHICTYIYFLCICTFIHTYIRTYMYVYASILCVTVGWLSLVALTIFYYSCFSIVALYSVFRVLPRPSLVVVIWLTWVFVHLLCICIPCLNRDCRFVNLWQVEVWLGQ